MAVRQELSIQKEPVVRISEKKIKGLRKALTVTAAATGLAISGLIGYGTMQQNPESAPIAGEVEKLTSQPILVAETYLAQKTFSKEDAEWLKIIPVDKAQRNDVPMNPKSIENYNYVMDHQLQQGQEFYTNWDSDKVTINELGTIVDVIPDPNVKGIWVGVDVPGDKLTKIVDENGETKYYGLTTWYLVQNDISVENGNNPADIKTGLKSIAPYLQKGDYITFAFQAKNLDDPYNEMNYNTFWILDNSIGYPDAREDTTGCKIKTSTAIIYPNQNNNK